MIAAAACALPLYFPPVTSTTAAPPPEASLLARLFPSVPQWWIVLRLIATAIAIVLAGAASVGLWHSSDPLRGPAPLRPRGWMWAAFMLAVVQALAGTWAGQFSRPAQLLYAAVLAGPAVLLLVAQRRDGHEPRSRAERAVLPVILTAAVIVLWAILRAPTMWHSPRVADLVDGWDGLQCLEKAAREDFNILTDSCYPGYTALPLLIQGAGILGWHLPLTFESLQAVHLAWIAAAAAGVAWAAGGIVAAAAAPVAAAAFLFAPLELMSLLWSGGAFVFAVYCVALVLAGSRIERTRSPAAVVAFGAVAGIALRCPPLVLLVVFLGARCLISLRRSGSLSVPLLATAALSCWAAFGPGLHEAASVGRALTTYGSGHDSWPVLEAALFGEFSPRHAPAAIGAVHSGSFDVLLGLLVLPFAAPRTPVRLIGDVIMDPLGAALAVLGLGAALRAALGRSEPRLLLGVLACVLLPGLVSSYDRVSLSRLAAATVPLALLAGTGFEALRRTFGSSPLARFAPAIACAAIAVSGVVIFDFVNPKILPRSAMGIVASELEAHPELAGAVVILDGTAWKPRYTRTSAQQVPRTPPRVINYAGLPATVADAGTAVVFWSRGVEEDYAVKETICRGWPEARIYELTDATGFSAVFAVSREAVPAWRDPRDCAAQLETEAVRARRALQRAADLASTGQRDEAAAQLEAQARRTFGHAELFDATARSLLALPANHAKVERALGWSLRACDTTRGDDPRYCATVAEAHAARGDWDAAVDAAHLAKDAAVRRGDAAAASDIEKRIQEYTRSASRVGG